MQYKGVIWEHHHSEYIGVVWTEGWRDARTHCHLYWGRWREVTIGANSAFKSS